MAGLEQADDHVPGDAHLMGVLGAKDACKAAREAMVGEVSRDRGGEMSLAVAGDHGINDALEGRVRGRLKARLIAEMEGSVCPAREARTGS